MVACCSEMYFHVHIYFLVLNSLTEYNFSSFNIQHIISDYILTKLNEKNTVFVNSSELV